MIDFGEQKRGALALHGRHLLWAVLLVSPMYTSCGGVDSSSEVGATGPMCGPCDMTMPADHPLTEISGMKFAVCGGRCEELISADPERYRGFAVGE